MPPKSSNMNYRINILASMADCQTGEIIYKNDFFYVLNSNRNRFQLIIDSYLRGLNSGRFLQLTFEAREIKTDLELFEEKVWSDVR